MLIGFVGKKQAGKTTAANFLGHNVMETTPLIDIKKNSFAEALKQMCINAGIGTRNDFLEKKEYYRDYLKLIGTKIVRDQIDPNYWVDKVEKDYSIFSFNINNADFLYIIDDVRFKNEAEMIKSYGGFIVKISRPHIEDGDNDRSETELEEIEPDRTIINNGSLKYFRRDVLYTCQELLNIKIKII